MRTSELSREQVNAERGVGWVYHWIFWTSLITVPWMRLNLVGLSFRYTSTSNYVGAALWPAVIHVVLLLGLNSPYLYVRRHTQQALLFVGLRALSTFLFIGLMEGSGACFWTITNGALWMLGSVWGRRQLRRGDCWLMRVRGEAGELPRPWAARPAPTQNPPPVRSTFTVPVDPDLAFAQGRSRVGVGQRAEAVVCFLAAFHIGPPDLRRRAVAELEKLGEVETF